MVVRPVEVAGAALIGVLSGIAAAVIPAIGAGRMRPVDALAERFRTSRSARRRTALTGAALVTAGVLSRWPATGCSPTTSPPTLASSRPPRGRAASCRRRRRAVPSR